MKALHNLLLIGIASCCIMLTGCHSKASQTDAATVTESTDTIIDVDLYDLQRNKVTLYTELSKNRFTVIDFWASWCTPCRAEAPLFISVYNKYKDKGVGFIGVSLDHNFDSWKAGIEELQLPWAQYAELRGWEDTLIQTYNIKGIPHTMVVDNEGHILAQGMRGEELLKFFEDKF